MRLATDSLSILNEAPFTAADRMIVSHLREDWGESNNWMLLAAALCSLATREGHVYYDLSHSSHPTARLPRYWPDLSEWSAMVSGSPIARREAETGDLPLVLCDQQALYLEKYYRFEQRLATLLRQRSERSLATPAGDPVERASRSSFFVITGGPGTGKTTLALRYLNRLLDRWEKPRPPRFATIAPTGKAAARLAESINQGITALDLPAERREKLRRIPCLTIHRLLGTLPHQASFRRNAKRTVDYDTLVVDESSMVDLPLMLRLLEALPPDCQVLLLGDKDQLASVAVGSVLNDLLQASTAPESPLRHHVERLTKTYRFREDSTIYRACQIARLGDAEGFGQMLEESGGDFDFHPIAPEASRIPNGAIKLALARYERIALCSSPEQALATLNDSIVLTPTRRGPFGSVEFNTAVERTIRQKQEAKLPLDSPLSGAPIIVLENDYELELFNGDLGVIWSDEPDGVTAAYFQSATGQARRYRLSELPRHESAFALTIHKSQGSEFRETIALFGPQDSQLLTRELVYTAFSRAKERLVVYANAEVLSASVTRQASRATRLAELLV